MVFQTRTDGQRCAHWQEVRRMPLCGASNGAIAGVHPSDPVVMACDSVLTSMTSIFAIELAGCVRAVA